MSRVRDRGSLSDGPPRVSYWWNTSQNPKPAVPANTPVAECYGTIERMVDEEIPDFYARRARGELFFNPMFSRKEDFFIGGSVGPVFKKVIGATTYWGELRGGPWQTTPRSDSVPINCPIDVASLRREAATAALGKVNKTDFEGLVTLGELRETLSYLRNPFKTGLKLAGNLQTKLLGLRYGQSALLSSLKKKGYTSQYAMDPRRFSPQLGKIEMESSKKEVDLIRNTVNLYMEFRYAVRPLIFDVEKFLTAQLEPYKMRRAERQTYRSGRTEDATAKFIADESISGGAITYKASYDMKRSCKVSAGYLYEFEEGLTEFERHGLSFSSLPSAALELVPLSFVAGWFFNTAALVAALTPKIGAHQLGSWLVEEQTFSVAKTASGWKFSDWQTTTDGYGTDSVLLTTKSRTPLGFGDIGLVLKQDFKSAFGDPWKLLDMGSIIFQRVMGQKISSRT